MVLPVTLECDTYNISYITEPNQRKVIEKCENEEPDAMILAMLVSVAEFLLDCSSLDEFNLYITTSLPSGFAIQPLWDRKLHCPVCSRSSVQCPVCSWETAHRLVVHCAVGKCQQ